MSLDPYVALGVEPDAPPGEIRRAYRRKAKKLHPDANPSSDSTREFQRLNEAYRLLRDPRLKLAYDASTVGVPQTFRTFPEFGSRPNASPLPCHFCRKPAVVLPTVDWFLMHEAATPARTFIDRGIPGALATDFNPGTSPTPNLALVLSLAVLRLGLTPGEALAAATINAAASLRQSSSSTQRGSP